MNPWHFFWLAINLEIESHTILSRGDTPTQIG